VRHFGDILEINATVRKKKSESPTYTLLIDHGETKPKPRNLKSSDPNPHASGEPRCLFRATNGKSKVSTIVSSFSNIFYVIMCSYYIRNNNLFDYLSWT